MISSLWSQRPVDLRFIEKQISRFPWEILRLPSEILGFPNEISRFPWEILRFPKEILRFPGEILWSPEEILRFPKEISRFPKETRVILAPGSLREFVWTHVILAPGNLREFLFLPFLFFSIFVPIVFGPTSPCTGPGPLTPDSGVSGSPLSKPYFLNLFQLRTFIKRESERSQIKL